MSYGYTVPLPNPEHTKIDTFSRLCVSFHVAWSRQFNSYPIQNVSLDLCIQMAATNTKDCIGHLHVHDDSLGMFCRVCRHPISNEYHTGPLLLRWFTFNLAWISNYIHYNVWDEISYPSLNFKGCTVEVWEWISNFISHFARHVITYPCLD